MDPLLKAYRMLIGNILYYALYDAYNIGKRRYHKLYVSRAGGKAKRNIPSDKTKEERAFFARNQLVYSVNHLRFKRYCNALGEEHDFIRDLILAAIQGERLEEIAKILEGLKKDGRVYQHCGSRSASRRKSAEEEAAEQEERREKSR